MKKQFFYAAAAVAALASCSSNDELANEAPEVGASAEQIVIGVNAPAAIVEATRGTGTVGDVDPDQNKWEGQKVSVYMFEQNAEGTLELAKDAAGKVLYGNAETMLGADMITPGGNWAGDAQNPALALREDYEVRYYANGKKYDFFGYHTGGATLGVPALDAANKVLSADITIDGTNDVMLASTNKEADLAAKDDATVGLSDLYSAKASREGVKPNLNFSHELTRLTFTVDGGTSAALKGTEINTTNINYPTDAVEKAKWVSQVEKDQTDGKLYEGWYIDAIKVRSNSTGKVVLATLDDATEQQITWNEVNDENPEVVFTLMERENAADKTADLVELTPVQPVAVHASGVKGKAIGDALFVAPKNVTATYDVTTGLQTSTTDYEILVEMHQYVPMYEAAAAAAGKVTQKYTLNKPTAEWKPVALNASKFGPQAIQLSDGKTTKGYSFNINITVYSAEKVELNSNLENWQDGGNTDITFE